MLSQPRRLISAGVAIMLGIAFIAATLILSASLNTTVKKVAAGPVGDAALVLTAKNNEGISTQLADAATSLSDVTSSRRVVTGYTRLRTGGADTLLYLQSNPTLSDDTRLVSGRLPDKAGEMAISTVTRDASHLEIGSTLTTPVVPGDEESTNSTVVGIIDVGADATSMTGMPFAFGTESAIMSLSGMTGYSTIYLNGTSPDGLRTQVQGLSQYSQDDVTVRTGAEEVEYLTKQYSMGNDQTRNLLLGFAAIALFVSTIVIANTFTILVAQRVRQLAMLRCVGATKRQIFAMVLGEAAVLGLVGSAAGVLVGIGLARLIVGLSGNSLGTELVFAVSPASVTVPIVIGLVITVLSSIPATRKATRVAPLAALRPELATARVKTLGIVRAIVGGLLIAAGAALLIYGFTHPGTNGTSLVLGIAGGMISFLGVLFVGRGLIPGLARAIGAPLKASVAGDIAVSNSRRNPGRSAATANALLVGATLISLLTVGAACSQATIDRELANEYPQDAIVALPQGVTDSTVNSIKDVQGVTDVALVPSVMAQVSGADSGDVVVQAVSDQAAKVSRIPSKYQGIADGEARTSDTHFTNGSTVRLNLGDRSTDVTVRVDKSYPSELTVTPATLDRLSPDAPANAWVRYADGTTAATVTADVARATGNPDAQITTAAETRAQFQQMVDIVLGIATGLLGVAVLIAIVGVGNTLSLSVLERTQEIGLLRALGMTRRQTRSMVGMEAVTIAAVAAVVGIGLGIVYGLIGSKLLLATLEFNLVVQLPWVRLAVIAAVAIAAGWLASLAPAARAVRIAPASALTTE